MLNEILSHADCIAIGGHVRPDGDCFGASFGLFQYIQNNYPEKNVDIYLEDIPRSFRMVGDISAIRHEVTTDKIYDLFICLDCGELKRLGFSSRLFGKARCTFCIDHHASHNDFAVYNYTNPRASSTSELVYELMDHEKIDKKTAELLFIGIAHDTGIFSFSCTAPSTHRMAADLLSRGVDGERILRETFYVKSFEQNRILGHVLERSRRFLNDRVIVGITDMQTMLDYGVTDRELEGIVNHLKNTRGVETAIYLYEVGQGVYKVSLRSTESVDVNHVAGRFGGGGHKKAAGATMTGSSREIIDKLLKEIGVQLDV